MLSVSAFMYLTWYDSQPPFFSFALPILAVPTLACVKSSPFVSEHVVYLSF